MGPIPAYSSDSAEQAGAPSPRRRRCLLKGCEAWFRPTCPLARYCSQACRDSARRWSQWQANRRYRKSAEGKVCRREQCRRRRQRCRQAGSAAAAASEGDSAQREGYQEAESAEKIACGRPGCYDCFTPSTRSPLKKFCSPLCRRALRRVRQREARWRRWARRLGVLLSEALSRRH